MVHFSYISNSKEEFVWYVSTIFAINFTSGPGLLKFAKDQIFTRKKFHFENPIQLGFYLCFDDRLKFQKYEQSYLELLISRTFGFCLKTVIRDVRYYFILTLSTFTGMSCFICQSYVKGVAAQLFYNRTPVLNLITFHL